MNKGKLIISRDEVWYEYLFPVFAQHGLTLTQTEIMDIIYEVHKVTEKGEGMEKQEIINRLKETHPYPDDIFIEPTKEQWKQINKVLQDAGFNETGVHGSACRIGYNSAIYNLERILE